MSWQSERKIIPCLLAVLVTCLIVASMFFLREAEATEEPKPFTFAVSAMASPATTFIHFTEFRDYLAEKLGRPVIMKQRRTYAEINQLLAENVVSMAFTCTGGFLEGRRTAGLEAIAVPIIGGKTSYQSYIIVANTNPAQRLEDLKGSIFAFTDSLSLTGRLYPTAAINALGFKTGDFFRKTFFTASHDKSIISVAEGVADAAAVDSLIFDSLLNNPESATHRVKIIHASPPFGMPPIVVPAELDKTEKRSLLKILLNMAEDPHGKEILDSLGMDGFVIPDATMYRSALLMIKQMTE